MTACFTCYLPSGSIADEWTIDGHGIKDTGPFLGSLIITNPSSLFSLSSTTALKCGNKTTGENFTTNVYMRGKVLQVCKRQLVSCACRVKDKTSKKIMHLHHSSSKNISGINTQTACYKSRYRLA